MRLRRRSNAQVIDFAGLEPLGRGGEARVYLIPSDSTRVAKIYHRPVEARRQKLHAMLNNPPIDPMAGKGHVSIAWPQDLLYTNDNRAIMMGYVMHRIQGMRPIIDYFNPATRRKHCPLFNYQFLIRTARNLATTVKTVHERGYVIGDINESNVLVANTALVTLVDTDSFQVRDPRSGLIFRCTVGKPEYTPPELQNQTFSQIDRSPEHDLFGLAVLIFSLLMEGTHPFDGIYQGAGNPPLREERIAAGNFVYGPRPCPYRVKPSAPPWKILPPAIRDLFLRCFDKGHLLPSARPAASEWQEALFRSEQDLVICPVNDQHWYGVHLRFCPWCERTEQLGGRDPFPAKRAVQDNTYNQPAVVQSSVPAAAPIDTQQSLITPVSPAGALVPSSERRGAVLGFLLASIFAAFLGYIGLMFGLQFGSEILQAHEWQLSTFEGLCGAIAMGLIQALFLRKWLPASRWGAWILCTAAGGALGGALDLFSGLPGLFFMMGLGVVAGQSFLLRRETKNWGLWPAAGCGGIMIAGMVQSMLGHGDGLQNSDTDMLVYQLLVGTVQGMLGGTALVFLEKK